MKILLEKSHQVANDAVCIVAVIFFGAMLYAGVLGMQQTSLWQTLQSSAPTAKTASLSNKKTCIVVAWQKQAGIAPSSMDRLRCAEYIPLQNDAPRMFADNR